MITYKGIHIRSYVDIYICILYVLDTWIYVYHRVSSSSGYQKKVCDYIYIYIYIYIYTYIFSV
jgi:hypothetical protein